MVDKSLLSFILRGKKRITVLKTISKDEVISAQIEEETKMYKSHVSRTLKELRKKKLIKCENPNDRYFKFYKITNLGKKVLEKIL
ncbi:MAG: MarR family transcriptional regulator, partial [Nanoarchaeota archaeon]|nr:MarR family transcriptional regulator [Nanoarchaeota archaeon]